MASVFLSYDREDFKAARRIAKALERAGHSVWWDRHIKSGGQFSKEIEEALNRADAVVVLWSEESVESAWVRDEAAVGRDTNRLVPALIGSVQPPLGFRQYQTTDLSRWKGWATSGPFEEILRAIGELGREPTTAELPAARQRIPTSLPWRGIVAAVVAALAIAAMWLWKPWERKPATTVVAIVAGSQSSSAQTIAQNLFVGLGQAQSGRVGSVQLVRAGAGSKADLILEVSGTGSAANLVLLRANDRQLVYSQELAAPAGRTAQLLPSLQIAAAATVDCAANAMAPQRGLPLDVLKVYLQACARFSSLYGSEEAYVPIAQLEQIVHREPQFVPAWKQLLLAGTFMRSVPTNNAKPSEQWLRTMIGKARRIDPKMPEVGLAEVELFPMTDFTNRMRLVDRLLAAHPDDMFVLGSRAEQLMLVGRNTEAVETAEKSVRLYPLAPYSRSEYARTLVFSGRTARAVEEIKAMDVLDVVAMNLTETKFRLNLYYGDPRISLDLFRTYGTNKKNEAFLLARIKPTPAAIRHSIGLARSDAVQYGYYAGYAEILTAFGRKEEVLDTLMRVPKHRADQFLLQTLFRPTLSQLREDPRFIKIAQRFGLLDYWQSSGHWPDFCAEPDLPYDCKVEAAKVET